MTLVTSKALQVLGLSVTTEQMWQDVCLSTWEILTNWSGSLKYFLFGHFPIISHPSSASCFFSYAYLLAAVEYTSAAFVS